LGRVERRTRTLQGRCMFQASLEGLKNRTSQHSDIAVHGCGYLNINQYCLQILESMLVQEGSLIQQTYR
jgi:hypothetical protein